VSLLPDFLAARLPGTLAEVEEVVEVRESVGASGAADRFRPPDAGEEAPDLASAIRWVERRFIPVRTALEALSERLPDLFAGQAPTLSSLRSTLETQQVLPCLREKASAHLTKLPPPLGFGPHHSRSWCGVDVFQHDMGHAPP